MWFLLESLSYQACVRRSDNHECVLVAMQVLWCNVYLIVVAGAGERKCKEVCVTVA